MELGHISDDRRRLYPVKLLVVEDEPRVAQLLARGLMQAQHVVDVVHTAHD